MFCWFVVYVRQMVGVVLLEVVVVSQVDCMGICVVQGVIELLVDCVVVVQGCGIG